MSSYPREPRAYELMAILLPDLDEETLAGAVERVSGYIADANGEIKDIIQDSPWGRRRLAYTIRFNGTDYRDGYYVIWHFDLVPSGMPEIERELKLDTRVIRYLIVHDDPKWGSPQEREAAAVAAQAATEAPAAAEDAPGESEDAGENAAADTAVAEVPATDTADAPAEEAEAPAAETDVPAETPEVEAEAPAAETDVPAETPEAEASDAEVATEAEAPAESATATEPEAPADPVAPDADAQPAADETTDETANS